MTNTGGKNMPVLKVEVDAGTQSGIVDVEFPIYFDRVKEMVADIFSQANQHGARVNYGTADPTTNNLIQYYISCGGMQRFNNVHGIITGRLKTPLSPPPHPYGKFLCQSNTQNNSSTNAAMVKTSRNVLRGRNVFDFYVCCSTIYDLIEEILSPFNRYCTQVEHSTANPTLEQLVRHYLQFGGLKDLIARYRH